MNPKLKKALLTLLAAALLFGSSRIQWSLNRDREALDLTRVAVLDNAPPVLAFTTIALGGFRGLIANMLWIRASDMQDEEKYFEMTQLTDWITKLEPNYPQVWVWSAWNLAYNISVKFPNFDDRWRWVKRGVELLRDEGLKYNPNETLIYHDLAWIFQHKLGANLDDANVYYKQEWCREMTDVFGNDRPSFDEFIHPQTPEQKERARLLTEKYKMDPQLLKELDDRYGPLEWRLPESQAIYWAAVGLKKAGENPTKVKPEELITLRRVIYQSMQMSVQRGKLVLNPFRGASFPFDFGPNLDIISKASQAYEEAIEEDKPSRENISQAYRNFLRYDVVDQLFLHNRLGEAAHWYEYLGKKYPDKHLVDGLTNSLPRNLSLEQYAMARIQADIENPNNRDKIRSVSEGLLTQAYGALVLNQNNLAEGYEHFASIILKEYQARILQSTNRIPMPPISQLKQGVVDRLLNPQEGWPPELRAALRQKLGLGPEAVPAGSTNAPPPAAASR
jgi:hypothetical protein